MAVGLDQDTDLAYRASIPSGGAGTLSDAAFANNGVGVWVYRPSGSVTYALTAAAPIIGLYGSARNVVLGFDSAGALLSDLHLQIVFNSGGGAGTPAQFTGHLGDSFLDEWVYYFIYEDGTNQVAGYIRLAAPTTVVKLTRANDNAGSQYANSLAIGGDGTNVVLGHYAYARAYYGSGLDDADMIAWAASSAPIGGEWGFWPLDNNTDTADDSGNGRSLTFNGTLTSETSPTLGGGGGGGGTDFVGWFDAMIAPAGWFDENGRPLGWFDHTLVDVTTAGGGAVTGTFTAVETGADTFAATGAVAITGTLVATETGADVFVATGAIAITGTFAATETGADTFAATGSIGAVTGTFAATETGADTFAATGSITITGTLTATETGTDTFAATGLITITGTLTATETGADTFTATGTIAIRGALAATETGVDTFAATGTVDGGGGGATVDEILPIWRRRRRL